MFNLDSLPPIYHNHEWYAINIFLSLLTINHSLWTCVMNSIWSLISQTMHSLWIACVMNSNWRPKLSNANAKKNYLLLLLSQYYHYTIFLITKTQRNLIWHICPILKKWLRLKLLPTLKRKITLHQYNFMNQRIFWRSD